MTATKRTLDTPYRLTYNEYGNAIEYIARLESKLKEPLGCMEQLEGDIYMSDYRELMTALWLINNKDT